MKQRDRRQRRHDRSPRLEGSPSRCQQQRPLRNSLRKSLEAKKLRVCSNNYDMYDISHHCSSSRCNNTKKRRSFLDASSRRKNVADRSEEDVDSISVTLSTVSMSDDDDDSSCCFDANEIKMNTRGEQQSKLTTSYNIDVRVEVEEDDGYSSDQAVCDSVCPISSAELLQPTRHKKHIHIIDQDETKIKQEAQQIANRLLQEQTIALEAWNEVASEYHRRIEPFTSSFIPHLLDAKHISLKQNERMYLKGKSVLDVACGTGAGALYAMSRGASSVMATDFSENMIHVLKRRIQDHPTLLPVETSVANGLCLPLRWENKYDIVFSNFGCIYFSKVQEGLCEMIRCTKPGGKVCLSAWGNKEETHAFSVFPAAMKRCGLDRRWFEAQSTSRKEILALAGIEPTKSTSQHPRNKKRYSGISLTPNYICPTTRISSSQYSLYSMMTDAGGLTDVQVIPVTNDLKLDSAKNYWKRFVLASPNLKRFVEHCLSTEEVMALRGAVSEVLREKMEESPSSNPQEGGGVVLKASAYIAIGTKKALA